MELVQGCSNKADLQTLEKFISDFEVIWPTPEIYDEALEIFTRFSLSHHLGLLDALIGQTAVVLNSPIYTFNRKHYTVIPDLVTVQPYQR